MKERCVAAVAVGVDRGAGIDIGTMLQQPRRDLELIVLDGQMKQRRTGNRRDMHAVARLEPQLRRQDLRFRESSAQELRIALQVCFEQIDAPTMKRHAWRVRQRESVLRESSRQACLPFAPRPYVPRTIATGASYFGDTLGLAPCSSSQRSERG